MPYEKTPIPQLLTFDRHKVGGLLRHSLQATDRSPAASDGQEEGNVPPGLWLCAGEGVYLYLMSNGRNEQGKHGNAAHPVTYALEANPATVPPNALRAVQIRAFGGNDGLVFLSVERIENWLKEAFGHLTLAVECDGETIHFELVSDLYPIGADE